MWGSNLFRNANQLALGTYALITVSLLLALSFFLLAMDVTPGVPALIWAVAALAVAIFHYINV